MLDRYDQDLLLDYLEGELDEDRRAPLDAMLAGDPQLAALLNEMARDREALRSLPQAEAPADLVHDVTQTLERRMLLDDTVDDTAPIPISRAMAGEPTRSISWGRVVGLTGLAASVALAAGILVITFDDTLQRTANEFADSTSAGEEVDAIAEAVADEAVIGSEALEGLAALDSPDGTGLPGPGSPVAPETDHPGTGIGESVARHNPSPTPGIDPAPELSIEAPAGDDVSLDHLAFGSPAAISVIQPRQQLVLLSESPEISREQLFEFCVANGIPVVKPDQLSHNATGDVDDDAAGAALANAGEDAPLADYALLINESQLDTLMLSLNNDVNLEPKRAGKASLISNQAALLEDLPEGAYAYRPNNTRAALDGNDPADEQADLEETNRLYEQQAQQAIQLRSPDLGSAYNNTRNAYNLQSQQQAGYAQQRKSYAPDQQAAAPESPDEPNTTNHLAEGPQAERSEADRGEQPPRERIDKAAEAEELTPDSDSDEAHRNTEQTGVEPQQLQRRIDPSRGNWLSAHLPVADTTPLLLPWREGQTDRPTKLVPVKIKRAEPDKVNSLRVRQQAEYASRARESSDEVEADVALEAEAPAEAEPSEPAE